MFTRTSDLCARVAHETGSHGANVAVINHRTWELLAATDADARTIDDLQFTLGEGPSLDTADTSNECLVPDLGEASAIGRWPVLAGELNAAGVGAVFTFPVDGTSTRARSVLTVYRRSAGPMLSDHLAAARRCATEVTGVAGLDWSDYVRSTVGDTADPDRIGVALAAAPPAGMEDRADIHTAAGIVAAQLDLPPREALTTLRAHSFRTNTPLPDVARRVIETRERIL